LTFIKLEQSYENIFSSEDNYKGLGNYKAATLTVEGDIENKYNNEKNNLSSTEYGGFKKMGMDLPKYSAKTLEKPHCITTFWMRRRTDVLVRLQL